MGPLAIAVASGVLMAFAAGIAVLLLPLWWVVVVWYPPAAIVAVAAGGGGGGAPLLLSLPAAEGAVRLNEGEKFLRQGLTYATITLLIFVPGMGVTAAEVRMNKKRGGTHRHPRHGPTHHCGCCGRGHGLACEHGCGHGCGCCCWQWHGGHGGHGGGCIVVVVASW